MHELYMHHMLSGQQAVSENQYKKLSNKTERQTDQDGLQEGGYVLYARHAEATVGQDQQQMVFQDCETQRNLSDEGRRQAETYGETLRALDIPINYPVITSPFCRNIDTASLAFGDENYEVNPFLFDLYLLSYNPSPQEQQRILNTFRSMLETPPPEGTNTLIIGHSFPPGVAFGPIPDMGTVMVKPHGQGQGFDVVANISFENLTNMLG
ncbi:histidine phosphatase family protein [Bacillus shivajii]|uniref:histidine phosphatase family protein n=1 Tax=Bacillus shivajii TaxID=1983719 RepID=UPI001CF963C2|nr:histidine phosphatase family protein [Bacillus shivajii]UCZ54674.1 histidine phosphatase family protein [Bacillus shivajii]